MSTDPVIAPEKKRKGGRPPGPSRAELLARISQLEQSREPVLTEQQVARLRDAEAELATLQPAARLRVTRPLGPPPPMIPYTGYVRAKEKCSMDGYYEIGDVFQVKNYVLWSDDPFDAVIVRGQAEDGSPITEPNTDAPPQVDFRHRRLSSEVSNIAARDI